MSNHHTVRRLTGIAYDPQNELRLDLYLPEGAERPPVAVYLHGGAWLMGHRAEFAERLEGLAAHGLAVASIDYRTVNIAPYPAQHEDILRALAWVEANADEYGLGRGPVVLMGSSAGAHLAALTAFRLDDPARVGAFVGLFGRYNLMPGAPKARPGLEVPTVIRASTPPAGFADLDPRARLALLAGTTAAELGDEDLERLSPIRYAGAAAPAVLLAHGTRDAIVDHRHSLDLAAKLADAGSSREVVVVLIPGANHEDDAFAGDDILRVVAEFAQRNTRPALARTA